jgi:hypothetical protein
MRKFNSSTNYVCFFSPLRFSSFLLTGISTLVRLLDYVASCFEGAQKTRFVLQGQDLSAIPQFAVVDQTLLYFTMDMLANRTLG